ERGNINYTSDRDLVVSSAKIRCREDQVRIAERPVGVKLAVNHIKIACARGFDAQTHALTDGERSVNRDAFRRPFRDVGFVFLVFEEPDILVIVASRWTQSPERDTQHTVSVNATGWDSRSGDPVVAFFRRRFFGFEKLAVPQSSRLLFLWEIDAGVQRP